MKQRIVLHIDRLVLNGFQPGGSAAYRRGAARGVLPIAWGAGSCRATRFPAISAQGSGRRRRPRPRGNAGTNRGFRSFGDFQEAQTMNTTAPLQQSAPKCPVVGKGNWVVQRKCACNSSTSSLSGECSECRKKKWLGLQTKLVIGTAYDPLEQEADRVANQVMSASGGGAFSDSPIRIQRFSRQQIRGNRDRTRQRGSCPRGFRQAAGAWAAAGHGAAFRP